MRNWTMKMDEATRTILQQLAELRQQTASDVVRDLVRRGIHDTMNDREREIDHNLDMAICYLRLAAEVSDAYYGKEFSEPAMILAGLRALQDEMKTKAQTRINLEAAYRLRGIRIENEVEP